MSFRYLSHRLTLSTLLLLVHNYITSQNKKVIALHTHIQMEARTNKTSDSYIIEFHGVHIRGQSICPFGCRPQLRTAAGQNQCFFCRPHTELQQRHHHWLPVQHPCKFAKYSTAHAAETVHRAELIQEVRSSRGYPMHLLLCLSIQEGKMHSTDTAAILKGM